MNVCVCVRVFVLVIRKYKIEYDYNIVLTNLYVNNFEPHSVCKKVFRVYIINDHRVKQYLFVHMHNAQCTFYNRLFCKTL